MRARRLFSERPHSALTTRELEPVQRRIERALLDAQDFFGDLSDVLGDAPAVALAARERAQDQHVERPLDQLAGRLLISHRCLIGSYARPAFLSSKHARG